MAMKVKVGILLEDSTFVVWSETARKNLIKYLKTLTDNKDIKIPKVPIGLKVESEENSKELPVGGGFVTMGTKQFGRIIMVDETKAESSFKYFFGLERSYHLYKRYFRTYVIAQFVHEYMHVYLHETLHIGTEGALELIQEYFAGAIGFVFEESISAESKIILPGPDQSFFEMEKYKDYRWRFMYQSYLHFKRGPKEIFNDLLEKKGDWRPY